MGDGIVERALVGDWWLESLLLSPALKWLPPLCAPLAECWRLLLPRRLAALPCRLPMVPPKSGMLLLFSNGDEERLAPPDEESSSSSDSSSLLLALPAAVKPDLDPARILGGPKSSAGTLLCPSALRLHWGE